MSQQIVILAGGKGTRMAAPVPKVLVPLNDKPIIQHLLDNIVVVPQDTAPVIVVGHQAELVKKALGDNYLYALQEQQNGTAHAVSMAKRSVIAKNIIVLCGDMPFIKPESIGQLSDLHHRTNAKISMFTGELPNFEGQHRNFLSFGRIIRDENGQISKIQEYADASEEEKQITEVNPGVYMFDSKWLWKHMDEIGHVNAQGEFYLTDIIEVAIRDQQVINTLPIDPEEMFGINTPVHLETAASMLAVDIQPRKKLYQRLAEHLSDGQFSPIKFKNTYWFWSASILASAFIALVFVTLALLIMHVFTNLTYKIITGFLTAILLSNLLSKFIVVAHRFYADRYEHLNESIH